MAGSDFRLYGTVPMQGIPVSATADIFRQKPERTDKGRLRRCGLCGNEKVELRREGVYWYVSCDRYCCNRVDVRYYENPDEAVYQWNTKDYILK